MLEMEREKERRDREVEEKIQPTMPRFESYTGNEGGYQKRSLKVTNLCLQTMTMQLLSPWLTQASPPPKRKPTQKPF